MFVNNLFSQSIKVSMFHVEHWYLYALTTTKVFLKYNVTIQYYTNSGCYV